VPSSFTAEEELETSREILRLEHRLLLALCRFQGHPVVADALRPRRRAQTRSAAVERLRAAVREVRGLKEPGAAAVAELWDRSEDLRWRLAMCCDHIARAEAEKRATWLLTENDLHTEGQIGLYRAALRFEPTLGFRFGTYAKWWVRAAMTRAIDEKSRTVRVSGNLMERRRNIRKLVRRLQAEGLPHPREDIAEWMGLSVQQVSEALDAPVESVSISTAPNDEDRHPRTEPSEEPTVLADLEDEEQSRWLWWALAQLRPRHRKVLRMVSGLDRTRHQHSLQEAAGALGVTRQRAQIIRDDALEALLDLPYRRCMDCPMAAPSGLLDAEAAVLDAVWDGATTAEDVAARTGLVVGEVAEVLGRLVAQRLLCVVAGGHHPFGALWDRRGRAM